MGIFQSKSSVKWNYKKILKLANSTFVLFNDFIFQLKTQNHKIEQNWQKQEVIVSISSLNNLIQEFLGEYEGFIEKNYCQDLKLFDDNLHILKTKLIDFKADCHREERRDFAHYLSRSDEISKLCEYIEAKLNPVAKPELSSNKADEWTLNIGDHYPRLEKIMRNCYFRVSNLKNWIHQNPQTYLTAIEPSMLNELVQSLNILSGKIQKLFEDANLRLTQSDGIKLKAMQTYSTELALMIESLGVDYRQSIISHSENLLIIIRPNIISETII